MKYNRIYLNIFFFLKINYKRYYNLECAILSILFYFEVKYKMIILTKEKIKSKNYINQSY